MSREMLIEHVLVFLELLMANWFSQLFSWISHSDPNYLNNLGGLKCVRKLPASLSLHVFLY